MARQVLFDDVVPVCVHAKDREDRNASLTVYISVPATAVCGCGSLTAPPLQMEWTQNHKQRILLVRLTEEADPFFLYQLTISEEDFQGARSSQCGISPSPS